MWALNLTADQVKGIPERKGFTFLPVCFHMVLASSSTLSASYCCPSCHGCCCYLLAEMCQYLFALLLFILMCIYSEVRLLHHIVILLGFPGICTVFSIAAVPFCFPTSHGQELVNPTESVTNINFSRQVGVSPDTTSHLRVTRML